MGLDMFLTGSIYMYESKAMRDGYPISEIRIELGYWRKHPNLHGYIVQNFADGVDDCKEICLSEKDLRKIIMAIKENELPITSGFFFGESTGEEKQNDLEIFRNSLKWLQAYKPSESKSIIYRASW